MMKIVDLSNGKLIASGASIAHSLLSRLVGVIGMREMPAGSAIIIPHCRQVHTMFVRFCIDVLFVDKYHRVIGVQECMLPFSVSGYHRKSDYVIELPGGTVHTLGIQLCDDIQVEGLR